MSNRFVFTDREVIDGSIEGVDFAPKVYCVARSPRAILIWIYGHSWSVNGFQRYAEPHFTGIGPRSSHLDVAKLYKRIGHEGGRLSFTRADELREDFAKLFEDSDAPLQIADAVRFRKTLLIEGGGPPLRPARSLGRDAYQRWADLPERGFYLKDRS